MSHLVQYDMVFSWVRDAFYQIVHIPDHYRCAPLLYRQHPKVLRQQQIYAQQTVVTIANGPIMIKIRILPYKHHDHPLCWATVIAQAMWIQWMCHVAWMQQNVHYLGTVHWPIKWKNKSQMNWVSTINLSNDSHFSFNENGLFFFFKSKCLLCKRHKNPMRHPKKCVWKKKKKI